MKKRMEQLNRKHPWHAQRSPAISNKVDIEKKNPNNTGLRSKSLSIEKKTNDNAALPVKQ